MINSASFEFPPEQEAALRRAKKLEWFTIFYLLSAVILMYFVMGSSQAMRTAWAEDILSIIPAAAFLIATRFCFRAPTKRFPYGYHRATSLAFLCAALALFSVGVYLLIDAVTKLIKVEHPTIGSIELFGQSIWLGWLMIPTLIYSGLPAMILGRAKLPLANKMHDKVLYADAKMNKADLLTAIAGIVGVLGIGYGIWWTDAAAAAVISLDIIRDGYTNMREVISNLMSEVPKTTDQQKFDPLIEELKAFFQDLPWVKDVEVRMREEGHVYFSEVFVVPRTDTNLVNLVEEAAKKAKTLDWRVQDLVICPVTAIPSEQRSVFAPEEFAHPAQTYSGAV